MQNKEIDKAIDNLKKACFALRMCEGLDQNIIHAYSVAINGINSRCEVTVKDINTLIDSVCALQSRLTYVETLADNLSMFREGTLHHDEAYTRLHEYRKKYSDAK